MRNFIKTITLVVIFLIKITPIDAKQQNKLERQHYGILSLSESYFTLLEPFDELNTIGGSSTSLQIGYQFVYKNIWLSFASEIQYWRSKAYTMPCTHSQLMYDTQGKIMTYHFDLQASEELTYSLVGYIPIMIGYTYFGFYIGIGANIGYPFYTKSNTKRSYITYATYPQYFEDFVDMPNHKYTTYSTSASEFVKTNISVCMSGEIGYDILYHQSKINTHTHHTALRIGLYVEYGLHNIISTQYDSPLFIVNSLHPTDLEIFPYYNHKSTSSARITPLCVGIRLTYLFRINNQKCNCK